jgi:CBS domain containing-hemolysin-like protein
LAIWALVALNGFFAAAEFSLVAVRLSRVRQLVARRNPRARIVLELLGDLRRVISGVQVGITLTSLALGAVGELTLARMFRDVLPQAAAGTRTALVVHSAALTLSFLLLTFLHAVLGELVPKSISLSRAERIALLVARPFHWYLHTFRWVIDLLDGASRWVVRALGIAAPLSHTVPHSAEELQIQVQQARERGLLAPGEERFILSALELGEVQVREIMVPRPDMHVLSSDASLEKVMRVFATTQRSRLPVFRAGEENVLGFLHIKDMIWVLLDRERRLEEGQAPPEFDLRHILRDVLIVPGTKPAAELLGDLRARRVGLAVVVDEHGSILGMVTLEDILEQLVGEIYDEFDVIERPLTLADGAMVFDASLNIRDLESQYNIALPEDPAYSTVGGFVLAQLGFIPRGGESFEHGSYRFTVLEMDGRRVARVKIQRLRLPEDELGAALSHETQPSLHPDAQAGEPATETAGELGSGTRTAPRKG